ncbi:hypothetical protein FRC10_006516 [Ceratobasidium sp. 414]|nr:hypothetical protein FRC10_006516 [Ceratobasidium sp. 414]
MSTSFQSEIRDVGEGGQEALRALLDSLVSDGQPALPNDASVSKLAEKLDELLAGGGGLLGAPANIARDDQGRPLNEEGLPIMDIVEPVTNDSRADPSSKGIPSPLSVSNQAPLSPLPNWALSPTALAARRRERDRILDMLEREEEELAREAAADFAARNEGPTPQTKLKHPSPPRTLDQVMGPRMDTSRPSPPTLVQAPTYVSAPLEHAPKNTPGPSMTADTGVPNANAARKPRKQKSVSFADPDPADHSNNQSHMTNPDVDWGDVVLVPLNSRGARKPGPNVMRELVVEHPPGQPKIPFDRMEDSDDEDEVVDDEDDAPQGDESDTEVPAGALHPSGVSDDESDDEDMTADVDETDFDEAMLQREIALAYYARRNQLGPDTTSGPLSDSTAMDQIPSDDDRGNVRPHMDHESKASRFRLSRLNGNPQTLINSAVQFGKLVNGQLVTGEVADREVGASLDELTGGRSDSAEDLTEMTIALLRGGDHVSQGEPTRSPTQSEGARPPMVAATSTLAPSGNIVAPQPKVALEPKPKPKRTAPATSAAGKQRSSRQLGSVPAAITQAFPPVIIESGFGFDPAFQDAPKPTATAAKSVAPMSETVTERPSTPIPHPSGRGRGKSRFAQASKTGGVKPQLSSAAPNLETPSTAFRGGEREAPPSRVQPPEPKRISRFRAERAGYL